MLFRRRHKPSLLANLRGWVWPKSGWRRAGLYVWHRLARLPGTPHSIAAGFACGAAVSFTPLLGLHILLGCALAMVVRGNLLATVIGTVVGNPWTFPLFFTLTGTVGAEILGESIMVSLPVWDWGAVIDSPVDYFAKFLPVVFPLIVGAIPVATAVWFLVYLVFKGLITRYRASRRSRAIASVKLEENTNVRQ